MSQYFRDRVQSLQSYTIASLHYRKIIRVEFSLHSQIEAKNTHTHTHTHTHTRGPFSFKDPYLFNLPYCYSIVSLFKKDL